ncbi:glycosyltransferase family 4 protein [Lactococcus lactis]|uniref:glycosyltransferase family 4 protein n=1 Tax=Lactococcus lactis TaxID=1358 RepID=UPI00289161A1|nr:glycosyltransferase family 4 protein [Lactococcus lactis]MDT2872725.1 glycosyltransferase family 4 protein [Lactococcus lactis]
MEKILYLHAGAEMYGADKVLLDLVTNLDKNKYCPIVILPNDGILVTALKEQGIDVRVINYPVLRRKFLNFVGMSSYSFNFFKYSLKLLKIIKDEKIAILHVNTTAVLEGVFLKMFSKIKLVWHVHEIIVSPNVMFKLTSKLLSKFSDKVITVSEAVKTHLLSSGFFENKKELITVIYNGVDSRVFNLQVDSNEFKKKNDIPNDKLVIGMIGRINRWKGQKDFISSISTVLANHSNTVAVLVGGVFEGEEWREEELKAMISLDPNKDRIFQISFTKEINKAHKSFDIFVLPSINPDPLPTVVLEAMATGKPIVGYNHGGITEMVKVGYNGILVEPRNIEELSIEIEKLIIDKKLRNQFGENSLNRQANFFSLNSYVHNFEEVYNNIID